MTTPTVPTVTDELIAELESAATDSKLNIYRPFGWDHSVRCGNHMQTDFDFLSLVSPETILALLAERADHLQQLVAAAVTAERYQWIRDMHNDEKGCCWVSVWDKDMPGWVSLDKAYLPGFELFEDPLDLDAAVDAARAIADT